MRMNRNDIRQELLDNWEQFDLSAYPEDLITEFAESAVPIFYSDIIKDWQEMDSEFVDSWQDLGTDNSAGILTLMSFDLFNYYQAIYHQIFTELKAEREAE